MHAWRLSHMIRIILVCALFALAGCKAEEVELRISTKQITDAIAGNPQSVRFQAEFSILSFYDEQLAWTINQVRAVVEKYTEIEEFDVTVGDLGVKIEIEGLIPLVYHDTSRVRAPWYVDVRDNEFKGVLGHFPYMMTFFPSEYNDVVLHEIQSINPLLSPDKFQPIKFKIKHNTDNPLHILTGGVEVNGHSRPIFETVIENRISLSMTGGVYDNTPALIFFNILEQQTQQ